MKAICLMFQYKTGAASRQQIIGNACCAFHFTRRSEIGSSAHFQPFRANSYSKQSWRRPRVTLHLPVAKIPCSRSGTESLGDFGTKDL
jgi:hypothetical protein